MNKLKIGDRVTWRGRWGKEEPKTVTVVGIMDNCVHKIGDPVDEIDWDDVRDRSVIVDLNNDHWAYGDQISQIKQQ